MREHTVEAKGQILSCTHYCPVLTSSIGRSGSSLDGYVSVKTFREARLQFVRITIL